jgi:hypothetical protein
MLAGGVLAAGVRDAVSEEDRKMELAAWYDYFFRTYHWTFGDVEGDASLGCPLWLRDRLPEIGRILNEIQAERSK